MSYTQAEHDEAGLPITFSRVCLETFSIRCDDSLVWVFNGGVSPSLLLGNTIMSAILYFPGFLFVAYVFMKNLSASKSSYTKVFIFTVLILTLCNVIRIILAFPSAPIQEVAYKNRAADNFSALKCSSLGAASFNIFLTDVALNEIAIVLGLQCVWLFSLTSKNLKEVGKYFSKRVFYVFAPLYLFVILGIFLRFILTAAGIASPDSSGMISSVQAYIQEIFFTFYLFLTVTIAVDLLKQGGDSSWRIAAYKRIVRNTLLQVFLLRIAAAFGYSLPFVVAFYGSGWEGGVRQIDNCVGMEMVEIITRFFGIVILPLLPFIPKTGKRRSDNTSTTDDSSLADSLLEDDDDSSSSSGSSSSSSSSEVELSEI